MNLLVRIFLREGLNLVFDKWQIMFTDSSETAKPNIFFKIPIQKITGNLLFLLKVLNLLNEIYREGTKG